MLYIWPFILCPLTLLCLHSHGMPLDFGDPTSIDFARALEEATEHRHKTEEKNLENEKEEPRPSLHHYKRHHKRPKHHRRSLKTQPEQLANMDKNGKRIHSPELHLHKRSKHLMLTKPYWPWP